MNNRGPRRRLAPGQQDFIEYASTNALPYGVQRRRLRDTGSGELGESKQFDSMTTTTFIPAQHFEVPGPPLADPSNLAPVWPDPASPYSANQPYLLGPPRQNSLHAATSTTPFPRGGEVFHVVASLHGRNFDESGVYSCVVGEGRKVRTTVPSKMVEEQRCQPIIGNFEGKLVEYVCLSIAARQYGLDGGTKMEILAFVVEGTGENIVLAEDAVLEVENGRPPVYSQPTDQLPDQPADRPADQPPEGSGNGCSDTFHSHAAYPAVSGFGHNSHSPLPGSASIPVSTESYNPGLDEAVSSEHGQGEFDMYVELLQYAEHAGEADTEFGELPGPSHCS